MQIWGKIRTVKQNTNKKMKNLSSSAHKLLLNIATKLKKFFIFLTQLMFTHKHNKWSQTFQPRPRWGLSRLCGSKVSVQACLAKNCHFEISKSEKLLKQWTEIFFSLIDLKMRKLLNSVPTEAIWYWWHIDSYSYL